MKTNGQEKTSEEKETESIYELTELGRVSYLAKNLRKFNSVTETDALKIASTMSNTERVVDMLEQLDISIASIDESLKMIQKDIQNLK